MCVYVYAKEKQNLWFINFLLKFTYAECKRETMLSADWSDLKVLPRHQVCHYDVLSPLVSSDLKSVTVIFSFTSDT